MHAQNIIIITIMIVVSSLILEDLHAIQLMLVSRNEYGVVMVKVFIRLLGWLQDLVGPSPQWQLWRASTKLEPANWSLCPSRSWWIATRMVQIAAVTGVS